MEVYINLKLLTQHYWCCLSPQLTVPKNQGKVLPPHLTRLNHSGKVLKLLCNVFFSVLGQWLSSFLTFWPKISLPTLTRYNTPMCIGLNSSCKRVRLKIYDKLIFYFFLVYTDQLNTTTKLQQEKVTPQRPWYSNKTGSRCCYKLLPVLMLKTPYIYSIYSEPSLKSRVANESSSKTELLNLHFFFFFLFGKQPNLDVFLVNQSHLDLNQYTKILTERT